MPKGLTWAEFIFVSVRGGGAGRRRMDGEEAVDFGQKDSRDVPEAEGKYVSPATPTRIEGHVHVGIKSADSLILAEPSTVPPAAKFSGEHPRAPSYSTYQRAVQRLGDLSSTLIEDDCENYGVEWRSFEKCVVLVCTLLHLSFWAVLYFSDESTSSKREDEKWWARLVFHQGIQFSSWSFFGYLVQRHGFRVGYSRKLCHFLLFFMPLLIMATFGSYQNSFLDFTWLVCASLSVFYIFIKPIRRRLPIPVLLMFKCIDRPKVRPISLHTLSTLATSRSAHFLTVSPLRIALTPCRGWFLSPSLDLCLCA